MATKEDIELWEREQPWGVFFDGTVFSVFVPEIKRYKYNCLYLLFLSYKRALEQRNLFKDFYCVRRVHSKSQINGSNVNWNSFKFKYSFSSGIAKEEDLPKIKNIFPPYLDVLYANNSFSVSIYCPLCVFDKNKLSFVFSTEGEAHHIADLIKNSGYTKEVAKDLTEYNFSIPHKDYQYNNDYITYCKGAYLLSIPECLRRSNSKKYPRSFFDFNEVTKIRDGYRPYFNKIPYRRIGWTLFRYIEEELEALSGANKEVPITLDICGRYYRLDKLSEYSSNELQKQREKIIQYINDAKDKEEKQAAQKDIECKRECQENNLQAELPLSYERSDNQNSESGDNKSCEVLLLNKDNGTFSTVYATSDLDILKAIVNLNTVNITILKNIGNDYIKVNIGLTG